MKRELVLAGIVVFLSSFCTLVIELVAGRMLAPYLGVSLYTWTSIIGVVLAGISLGAYAGGRVADYAPRFATLGWLLFLSGLAAFAIPFLTDKLGPRDFLADQFRIQSGLMVRIVVVTTFVFFLPSFFLGMISPVAVKLAVQDLGHTGCVVGRIYAISTLGSILGTFLTGFFLIASMGTRGLIFSVAAVLILSAPIFGGYFGGNRRKLAVYSGMTAVLFLSIFQLQPYLAAAYRHFLGTFSGYSYHSESDYFTIRLKPHYQFRPVDDVPPDRAAPLQAAVLASAFWPGASVAPLTLFQRLEVLVLDHLIHSHNDLNDPTYLHYQYLRIYQEVVRWRSADRPAHRSYFIGGGGYTFPRYLEVLYPQAEIHVAEIDPEVTRVAHDFLGIPRDTRIRTTNADARWHIMNMKEESCYDFIFGDAFNDFTVPYHLTTQEFARDLRRILKPDGILLVNLIDDYRHGSFLPSYIRTLESVFGQGHVHLLLERPPSGIKDSTFIVLASPASLDLAAFERARANWPRASRTAYVVPPAELERYLEDRREKCLILTDDFVPVDNMLAPLFEQRFRAEQRARMQSR